MTSDTIIILLLAALGYALLNPFDMVSEQCYDEVTYITTLNGIAAKVDSSGEIVTCTGKNK